MRCKMIVGYARVSTDGQTLEAQQAALKAAGVERVYAEKISGARSDRAQLAKLLKALGEGDTVIVTRLDRLARSTRDLLNILHAIGKAGATFKSLADSWADTTTPHGRLMVTILGGLAEFEARIDQSSHRRWPQARHGERQALRPEAQAERVSDRGSLTATRRRRSSHGHRPVLRRQPFDDLTTIPACRKGGVRRPTDSRVAPATGPAGSHRALGRIQGMTLDASHL